MLSRTAVLMPGDFEVSNPMIIINVYEPLLLCRSKNNLIQCITEPPVTSFMGHLLLKYNLYTHAVAMGYNSMLKHSVACRALIVLHTMPLMDLSACI